MPKSHANAYSNPHPDSHANSNSDAYSDADLYVRERYLKRR